MTTTLTTRNRGAAKVAAAGLIAGTALAESTFEAPTVDATYAPSWSRSSAYSLGETGLVENYDGTGSHSVWTDNDLRDELGADCSGYVNKVWAVQYQRAISYDDHGIGNTATWNSGAMDGSVEIALNDARSLNMDAWEYRRANNTGHMGVFEGSIDASLGYKTWNALSTPAGIRYDYRSNYYFAAHYETIDTVQVWRYASKRFKRVNWT